MRVRSFFRTCLQLRSRRRVLVFRNDLRFSFRFYDKGQASKLAIPCAAFLQSVSFSFSDITVVGLIRLRDWAGRLLLCISMHSFLLRRSIQIRLRPRRKDFLFPQKLSRWQVIDRRLTCPAFGTNARSTRFLTVLVEHSTWSTGTRADNSEILFSVTGNFLKR